MPVTDFPDWTKAIFAYQGVVSATQDFPDWTNAIFVTGGISPPASTPSGIPGLVAWFDATTITGVADNSPLSAWASLGSSSTYNLQQAGAFRPTYYSTTASRLVNGKPAVWFFGGQGMFQTPVTASTSQPWSVWMVAGLSSLSGTQTFWANDAGTTTPWLQMVSGNYSLSAGTVLTGPAVTSGVHLTVSNLNGASSQIVVDGAVTSGAAGAGAIQFGQPGQDGGAVARMSGFICEFAFYNRVLNANDLATIRAYTQAKWGTP